MAGGWTRDGAIQDQIDDTILDAVTHARSALPTGASAEFCVECGDDIPEPRRLAVQGVQTCILCQSERDGQRAAAGFNRRGSKDSQLK
ncbi:DksA/TraR family C4-type zinc finger protein [Maricaulis salignorans]|uniref:Phage/conjugal plasmid C-4 type zinc finger protein, TraR family n=1 Tax=Maricaulis salignorans TaxID=144026 RepID=A0A1G9VMB3_9PROT|nr:DksA/TraR family C4-type zinc finger protein [Maricaulis salignorans]SDM73247.1 phage/conjugal plasmid C-4 type zinc finger protein, TraR family [Maricaulis salignorans]